MDTILLRSFYEVASVGSFSEAARLLNASQSTVSGHIAKLEEHLQTQLFRRTTRSCQLTTAGDVLLTHATTVLRVIERIEEEFCPARMGGTIKLGLPDEYHLFSRLAPVLQTFMAMRPKVTIKVTSGLSFEHSRALADGFLDAALLREPLRAGQTPDLCPSQLIWIGLPDFDVERTEVLPLAHISGHCVYFREASALLDQAGIPWRSVYDCNTLEGIRTAVRSGLAIAAIPEEDCPDQRLKLHHPRLPELPIVHGRFKTAHAEPPVIVRQLLATLRDALQPESAGVAVESP
ncbi:LysR family transcriptional regulator [Burkholderia multivorans]|uniref:LysR family transcriptional regulator n=1 Tax=Burkholderia multivorans TaxID=87883 RepID=UPI002B2404A7|nr:LysR family transcriptional regulator [Burkholderia multivorans]MEB2486024.1 LysR family transcriptional regulator [Burkholderia multivorans]MEB2567630.1 LysR family transcriptional regulator [Burkholderia multivorans]